MQAYTDFAEVYDIFMDNTPYEEWCEKIHALLKEYGVLDGILLDLGCGTGVMTELFAKKGYDMIGVDNSASMLNIATRRREQSKLDILYLLQDMQSFELYGTVHGIISTCDSINYLLSDEELSSCFALVENYLDDDGVFIFDFNTVYKYSEIIGDTVIAENRDACSFIWENTYYDEEEINEYDLTVFVRDDVEDIEKETYHRFYENHYQKGYTVEKLQKILLENGLKIKRVVDTSTMQEPRSDSERIYIVAGK